MMADQEKASHGALDDDAPSALEQLSKTLENLEERLSRINSPAPAPRSGRSSSRAAKKPAIDPSGPGSRDDKPSLSEVVSKIAKRPRGPHRNWHQGAAVLSHRDGPSRSDRRTAMGGVAQQLEELRNELRKDIEKPFQARVDRTRDALQSLRAKISDDAGMDLIDAEIARLDAELNEMAQTGVDEQPVQKLRDELVEIRALLGGLNAGDPSADAPANDEPTVRQPSEEARAAVAQEPAVAPEPAVASRAADEPGPAAATEAAVAARADVTGAMQPQAEPRLPGSIDGREPVETSPVVGESTEPAEPAHSMAGAEIPASLEEPAGNASLKAEITALREQIETVAAEKSAQAVEERWDALGDRFASRDTEAKLEAMAERMAQLESVIEKLPETLSIEPLEQRVHAMSAGIEALTKYQQEEAEADHFAQLEERLDEISRAIVAAASRPPQIDMAPVERIEARLQNLTTRVDDMAIDGDTTIIEERLLELSERMEMLADDPRTKELNERIELFSARLETLALAGSQAAALDTAMEARLNSLAEKVEEASAYKIDGELVRSLEAQIGRLTQLIGEGSVPNAASGADELDRRFAEIERRLDENRDAIAHSARLAADEAIRQMLESGDFRHSEHVARLSEDLRSLENLSRESGSQSKEFFQVVHTTLTQLVERIQEIENDLSAGRREAGAPAVVMPAASIGAQETLGKSQGFFSRRFARNKARSSGPVPIVADEPTVAAVDENQRLLADTGEADGDRSVEAADIFDSPEANRPLAVGSGAPNITTLLARVRAQQAEHLAAVDDDGKADFIAAARRAAMAAAAEVDDLNASETRHEDKGSRFSEKASRRKKPILMAIGAVLLALMALPVATVLTGEEAVPTNGGTQTASNDGEATQSVVAAQTPADTTDAGRKSTPNAVADDVAAPIVAIPPETAVAVDETASPSIEGGAAEETSPLMSAAAMSAPSFEPPIAAADATAASSAPGDDDGSQTFVATAPVQTIGSADVAAAGAAASQNVAAAPQTSPAIPAVPDGVGPAALAEAARNGDPKAIFEVGLRLMEGDGALVDPKKAVTWFRNAAERGYAPAQYSLGTLYEKGNGLPRDTTSARDWYLKAAGQGNVRAMHNLAVLFATGIDGKSDPELAADWFERAADYGMTDSQYNLGILFARGAGVEQDLTQSYKWFSIVADTGDKDAAAKRDEVARSLTPPQLEAARQEVASFTALTRNEQANTVDIPPQWTASTAPQGSVDKIATSAVDVQKAVRNIQAILIKLGYNPGTPDGIPGAQTTEAIRSFQKEAGLDATGKIDESLILALLARKDT